MSLVSKLGHGKPEDLVGSIRRNLQALLGARRGYADSTQVFGLGDHDICEGSNPRISALVRDMTRQVLDHEPRLAAPRVAYVGRQGSMWAAFKLSGTVDSEPIVFTVLMHVVLRNVTVTSPPSA